MLDFFSRTNATRTLAFLGIAAAVGIGIAGYGLFSARGTSTLIVPPEDVATVNQRPVSRLDFAAQIQTLYAVPPEQATAGQKKKVLDDMIREELFVQRGAELDVAGVDPNVRAAMVSAVEQQIVADAATRNPSDAELREYYARNAAQYLSEGTMIVRDLIAPSKETAQAAVSALRARFEPAALGSIAPALHDSGRTRDEEFYFAAKIHLGDALFAAAVPLNDGGVSDPIAQNDGFHVLVMSKNEKPVPIDFAQARAQVIEDWRRDLSARLLAGDERFLRKRAQVLIAPDLR